MVVTLEIFRVTMLAVPAHNKFMFLNFYFCSLRFVNKYMTVWEFSHFHHFPFSLIYSY